MTTSISDAGVQFADNSVQASAAAPQIAPVSATVGTNALTITLAACALAFRSTTLGSGAASVANNGSTLSLTVPSGATLGTTSGIASRIAVLALNVTGTMELAVVNLAGGTDLSETGLISTTAISGSATSASTVYSASGRSNVAYRVVGYVESTQGTAGTWATAPSTVQGIGAASMAAMQNGQRWQSFTYPAQRTLATPYYNTTPKMIIVSVMYGTGASAQSGLIGNVDGSPVAFGSCGNTVDGGLKFEVPPWCSYTVTNNSTAIATVYGWKELR